MFEEIADITLNRSSQAKPPSVPASVVEEVYPMQLTFHQASDVRYQP